MVHFEGAEIPCIYVFKEAVCYFGCDNLFVLSVKAEEREDGGR